MKSSKSKGVNQKSDYDEVMKFIKRSEFNMVDQLLYTLSKIYVLSLLINLEAHREAFHKVL